MPGTTFAAIDAAAGELDKESFAADAGAHASAEPRSTAVAAVATLEGTRKKVEIVMWVK
jgi:hypothetical protein